MTRPISSLHCLFSYDNKLGGSVHAALNVCKYLARGGHPVEMVAPFGRRDDVQYLGNDYSGLSCHMVARSFPQRYSNSHALGIWLRANLHRFQVVEIHGVWVLSTLEAARICRELNKPYFIRPHGSLDPFDLQKHVLVKRFLGPIYVRWLLRNSAAVICTSTLEAERLVTYGANPRQFTLPLPVPLADAEGARQSFRLKHQIPLDARVVLFLSRVDYKKGLDFLIPALGRLKSEYPDLWLVLAGTGAPDFLSLVRRWLDKHKVRAYTREVGFLSGQDKQDAFAAADVFALPSLNENFGIVNIEAMHAGLPLLVSDQVYICREIEQAGAGIVCRPDVPSVTARLREMLGGAVDLKKMGIRGRALVQQRYRPEAATATLVGVYAETLARLAKKQPIVA
jgi:glycosyltransferase involved in cell wall biosynthesis